MWFEPKIHDRREAGAILAEHLKEYAQIKDLIVLALPRGGVPVAFEVAKALRAPLDVFVVRKLGVPGQEEFAFGAIASGGVKIVNPRLVKALHLSSNTIERIVERELAELERRERLYRGSRPPLNVAGKTVIIVDDGPCDRCHNAGRDRGAKKARSEKNYCWGPGGLAADLQRTAPRSRAAGRVRHYTGAVLRCRYVV